MRRLQRFETTWRPLLAPILTAYGVSWAEVKSDARPDAVCLARQACCFVLAQHTALSAADIGKLLGGKHHSTVLHSIDRVSLRLEEDPALANLVRGVNHVDQCPVLRRTGRGGACNRVFIRSISATI